MPYEKRVRWRGNTKIVTFWNPALDEAVQRVQAEQWPEGFEWVPKVQAGPIADFPAGNYAVLSRSNILASRIVYWHIRLDVDDGRFIGPHTCDYFAGKGERGDLVCRHIALAWICWQRDRIANAYPWLKEGEEMPTQQEVRTGRELAIADPVQQQTAIARWEPSDQEIHNWLALAKVLKESEGTAIPKGLDSEAKIAAVLMAADAVGLEPRSALLTGRVFLVNGKAQLDGQAMASLVASYGGVIEWHEMGPTKARATIRMPGKPPFTYEFTWEMAEKAGLTKSQPTPNWINDLGEDGNFIWVKGTDGRSRPKRHQDGMKETNPYLNYPADMLGWKCVERLVRFGAPEVLNAVIGVAQRPLLAEIEDSTHQVAQVGPAPVSEPTADYEEAEYVDTWPEDSARPEVTAEPVQAPVSADSGDDWQRVRAAPFGMARPQDRQLLLDKLEGQTGTRYTAEMLAKVLRTNSAGLERISLEAIYDKLTGGGEPPTQSSFVEGAA
ncbi:MAG: hypothetical protein KGL39_11835 [Patescibacteria group bacterium]|nr:hypothetical protein [Patescibacteria group bacterium]